MILPYRGLSIDENSKGQWQYGHLIEDRGRAFIVNEIIEANEQYITIGSWCPVDNESVGRFTGLFDKNWQEIFEGDILKSNKYTTSVFYERGAYRVKLRRTLNTTVTMDVISFIEKYKTKVIGNIYENPELLEVDDD
ncbi:YopX protein [Streptococcus gordonii]|jgi:hypothetical protein|uniref:YopX family protein n=1 Tax=Streptococcus gordonii TaxID=1302 RepID=UPI000F679F8F|nr:YopX family protein [Streptococcus gordonii]RSJ32879.1 YopX protein [Streptococcus gordonii]